MAIEMYSFFWNREFLLCTAISIGCQLLQNSWQLNLIHLLFKESENLQRPESNILPPTPQPCL